MLLNIMQGSACPCQFYKLMLLPELWKGEGSLVGYRGGCAPGHTGSVLTWMEQRPSENTSGYLTSLLPRPQSLLPQLHVFWLGC